MFIDSCLEVDSWSYGFEPGDCKGYIFHPLLAVVKGLITGFFDMYFSVYAVHHL